MLYNKKGFTSGQKIIVLLMMSIMIVFLGIAALLVSKNDYNYVRTRGNSKTIMIYMAGTDLESDGGVATAELKSIVPKDIDLDNINILIFTGGTRRWHNNVVNPNENAIYKVGINGLEKIASFEKKSMGNPNTLTEFLNFGYNNYKSDSFDLFIWDHGLGVIGSSYDENTNDYMDILEFKSALDNSPFNKKNKLESVIFMTCLNGNLELASLFSNYAHYMVASEEVSLGSSSYGVFGFLGSVEKSSYGDEVGKAYVDEYHKYIDYLKQNTIKRVDSTYSVIDLSKIDTLNKKVNDLFSRINVSKDFINLARMRSSLHQYGEVNNDGKSNYDTVDLYELVDNLRDYSTSEVDDILNYIKNEVVIYNYTLNEHSNGLSIYFPYTGDNSYKYLHLKLYDSLNISSNYKKFVKDFNRAQTSTAYNFASDISDNEIEFNGSQVKFKLEGNQKINYLSSSYMILKKVNDGYEKVYKGTDSKLEGNYAVAGLTKKLIKVVNDNNNSESIIDVEKNNKENEYSTYARLYNDNYNKEAGINIYFDDTNTTNKFDINLLSNMGDGIVTNSGLVVDIKEFNKIDFKSEKYHIFNSSNEYIDDWFDNKEESTYTVDSNNFHFEKVDYNKDEYYFVFVVKDVQDNNYYSKLIELK